MKAAVIACCFGAAIAQQKGKDEDGPQLFVLSCNGDGDCTEERMAMTIDASWRSQHNASGWQGCIVSEGMWDTKLCPNTKTCAKRCAVDGLTLDTYSNKHGITESDGGIKMKYVTATKYGVNVGARIYMLEKTKDDQFLNYKLFKLKNREFAFDADLSTLPCGTNAALYLVAMDHHGGKGIGNNAAGAQYGTGYCDARCQHSPNFINGEANFGWASGACCMEIDLFEGNRAASAFTAHTCSHAGFKKCEGVDCGDGDHGHHYEGLCDKDGCDFNSYRMGSKDFYGEGKTVDTTKPFTIITQFITSDGTDSGPLSEIRRIYMLGSKVIHNSQTSVPGITGDSITDGFCNAQKQHFGATRAKDNTKGDYNQFAKLGGINRLSAALDGGMVLAMSLWDDEGSSMHWLDSTSPKGHLNAEGAKRGPCPRDAGKAKKTRMKHQMAYAKFTNLMYGPIGSTGKSKAALQEAFTVDHVKVAEAMPQQRSAYAIVSMGAGFLALVSLTALGLTRLQRRSRAGAGTFARDIHQGSAEQDEDSTQPLASAA